MYTWHSGYVWKNDTDNLYLLQPSMAHAGMPLKEHEYQKASQPVPQALNKGKHAKFIRKVQQLSKDQSRSAYVYYYQAQEVSSSQV